MARAETSTLELRDYFRVLWRHKWIILVTVVVCAALSVGSAARQQDEYRAFAEILLKPRLVEQLFVPASLNNANPIVADRNRANEMRIMSGPQVRAEVTQQLGYPPDYVSFVAVPGTDVIQLVATGTRPKRIAATVNAYADTYIKVKTEQTLADLQEASDQVQKLIDQTDQAIFFIDLDLAAKPPAPDQIVNGRNVTPTDERITKKISLQNQRSAYNDQLDSLQKAIAVSQSTGATVLTPASVPGRPINKSPWKNLIPGIAIGFVLGVALAFLREYMDDTVKTKDDLEAASGLGVIGIIPTLPDWKKRETTPLISMLQPRSPAAEAYRSIRTSVEFLSLDQPIGSIQVTSAHASEGKTSTLANLAVTFARAGQRVIVLCCDLRRPRVHEFFGLSNRVGFTSILLGDAPLAQAIQPADPELPIGVVASGPLPPNPAELLASKRAIEVIEELDRRCDILMIDSPPILPVTDGLVLSGMVDGVLLVGSAGSSTKRGVKRATELLRQVDAPLIGAILNGVGSKTEYGYAYGNDDRYYLESGPSQTKGSDKGRKASRKNGNGDAKNGSRPRPSARATR